MTYHHSKHHKLDDRTISNVDSIDRLMESLELLQSDSRKCIEATTLLDHMRRNYTRLNIRDSGEVAKFITTYESRYKAMIVK